MSLIEGIEDEDLMAKIDSEGFDYFFRSYVSTEKIKDATLYTLVQNYMDAAEALDDYLWAQTSELEEQD